MAGNLKINGAQFGDDVTASNNFTLTTPAAPDGSLTLSRGNLGATLASVLNISSAGNVSLQSTGAGITNMSSMNGGPLAGLRNRIINGAMTVAQRGYFSANASTNLVAGVFTLGGADRMRTSINVSGGSLTAGVIRVFADPPLSVPNGLGQCHAVSGVSTSGTGGSVLFTQFIEKANCQDLGGKTVTISAKVYQDTGATTQSYIYLTKAASANSFGNSPTQIAAGTTVNVPTGVLTTVTFTTTLSSTDAANGLAPVVVINFAGALSSKSFSITEFQLEEGPVATAFERRPYGLELSLCERYFQLMLFGAVGVANGTTTGFASVRLKPLVGTPTVTATGSITLSIAGAVVTSTLSGANVSTDGSASLSFSSFSPAVTNGTMLFISTANTNYIVFNAELG